MKKILLLLLCLPLLFSCGENERDTGNEENKVTISGCEITEDLWINEKYNSKDTIGKHTSSLYDGIKFLKNGEIKRYQCTQPFINNKSDTICKGWGLEKFMDTCCVLTYAPDIMFLPTIPNMIDYRPKWETIEDNIIVIIQDYPNYPINIGGEVFKGSFKGSNDTLLLLDCNRIKYGDTFYNRSPKLNNAI